MQGSSQLPIAIIGAGPAGLAVAACCGARGIPFQLLEQADEVGSSWRNHYERLHLHTARNHSGLPRLPFPTSMPTFPSRAQVVEYLDQYAAHFGLKPRFGVAVSVITPAGTGWTLSTNVGAIHASAVVVATGYNRVPVVPEWPGQADFQGEILHSAAYRTGRRFAGKRVLVVGAGNSGAEIALDLAECGAQTTMCIRSAINVTPRTIFGIPMQAIGVFAEKRPLWFKDFVAAVIGWVLFRDLPRFGIRKSARGAASQVVLDGIIPMIDIGTVAAIRKGEIRVVPGIERFTSGGVRCVDGTEVPADGIVLATGYRTGLSALLGTTPEVLDDRGRPVKTGAETVRPGLHFVGFRNPLTGFLRQIATDAEAVAAVLGARLAQSPPPPDQARPSAAFEKGKGQPDRN